MKNDNVWDYPYEKLKIDKAFLQFLREVEYRLDLPGAERDDNIVVPEDLSHLELLTNFNIDNNILKVYYAASKDLIPTRERPEHAMYPFIIGGAYLSKMCLFAIMKMILNSEESNQPITIDGNKRIKYLGDLAPYFKDYSQGFQKGFNEFKEKCITPFLHSHYDITDIVFKVFEYIAKNVPFRHSWISCHIGLSILRDNNKRTLIGGYDLGIIQGHYYRAWCTVFSNSKMYSPIFKEHYGDKETFDFENKFDDETEEKIYNYFKPKLVTDKKFLSEENFHFWLTCAFEKRTPPKKKIEFIRMPTKGKAGEIIKGYYDIASGSHGRKRKYCALFGEFFQGLETKSVYENCR